MALKLAGIPNLLFTHSQEFSQGGGNVRKGQGYIVVAKDGTGDFDDIQEAINNTSKEGGGTIFIKSGTYLIDSLTLADNVNLIGDYIKSVIYFDAVNTKQALIAKVSNVKIENLYFYFTGTQAEACIDVDGATDLEFNGCYFYIGASSVENPYGIIWTSAASDAKITIKNCKFTGNGGGTLDSMLITALEYSVIQNNIIEETINLLENTTGIIIADSIFTGNISVGSLKSDFITRCVISGNYFGGNIEISGGANSYGNIITGNHAETMTFGALTLDSCAVGNATDTAITDNGANVVGNNAVY